MSPPAVSPPLVIPPLVIPPLHPLAALKAALRARLVADAALLALLGGPRVHDGAPRGTPLPLLTFAEGAARDLSSSTERGHELRLALLALSRQGGGAQALAVIARAEALATAAPPPALAGHRLILIDALSTEAARLKDGAHRAVLRLRAVTEVL